MINLKKQVHLVQTPKWNEFKQKYGNAKIKRFGDVYIFIKKIPYTKKYMGYAPKINFLVQKMDFASLENFSKKANIAFIRLDVPNILKNTSEGKEWEKKLLKIGRKSPKNTFTVENIYLDLTPSEEEILKRMHSKKRYNIRYAQRKGIKIKIGRTKKDFRDFWDLHSKTAKRQMFLTHPKKYFETMWETLKQDIYFIKAYVNNNLATVWLIITTKDTIYYAYGGSDPKYNKAYPNDLVGFEAIRLGKKLNKKYFDMWGAEKGKGFTEFKLKYGAQKIRFLDSIDIVYEPLTYNFFNFSYGMFWKIQDIKRFIKKTVNARKK